MASSRPEMDASLGFGRGSAVREYWLKRCQGFSAVRADGSRLGRVKRVETQMEGTFLRLTGLRARTLPLSAIETVCPSASVLVISDERVDVGSEVGVRSERADERSAWTETPVPWWELVDDVRARGTERVERGLSTRTPSQPSTSAGCGAHDSCVVPRDLVSATSRRARSKKRWS